MEVVSQAYNELISLYHQLNRNLTWKDVVVYTSIPFISWWAYKILIQPFLSPLRKIPGRPYIPIVGNMFEALKKEAMSNTIDWMLEADSRFIRFYYLYGTVRLLVADPDIVKYIGVTNWQNYQHITNSVILQLFPKFLTNINGEEHKSLKKLLNPSFGRIVVDSFCDIFEKLTKKMIDDWDKKIGDQDFCIIEVQNYMSRLTMDAICKCGFDYKMNSLAKPNEAGVQSFQRILLDLRIRLVQMIPFINKLPFKVNVQKREDLTFFRKTIKTVFDEKKKNTLISHGNEHAGDLLSLLLKARDENNHGLSDEIILSQIGGFLFAGFETTSSALTWILLILSEYPEVQEKVRKEIQQVLPSSDKPITRHDFDKLTYLMCVINESLRLYPPVTVFFRKAVKDDVIKGYKIPAGTVIGISVSGLHRHPENWKDPEKFIPERFQEEYDHNKFMPFGLGPFMCIGNKFAMTEIQIILPLLLRTYRFHKIPGYKYRRVQNITMIPDPPMSLKVERV